MVSINYKNKKGYKMDEKVNKEISGILAIISKQFINNFVKSSNSKDVKKLDSWSDRHDMVGPVVNTSEIFDATMEHVDSAHIHKIESGELNWVYNTLYYTLVRIKVKGSPIVRLDISEKQFNSLVKWTNLNIHY